MTRDSHRTRSVAVRFTDEEYEALVKLREKLLQPTDAGLLRMLAILEIKRRRRGLPGAPRLREPLPRVSRPRQEPEPQADSEALEVPESCEATPDQSRDPLAFDPLRDTPQEPPEATQPGSDPDPSADEDEEPTEPDDSILW